MSQITVELSESTCEALEAASLSKGRSVSELVEESLTIAGIVSHDEVLSLLGQARRHSQLSEDEAMELAVAETRKARQQR